MLILLTFFLCLSKVDFTNKNDSLTKSTGVRQYTNIQQTMVATCRNSENNIPPINNILVGYTANKTALKLYVIA